MNHVLGAVSISLLAATLVTCGASSTEIADVSVVTTLPKEVGPGGYEKNLKTHGVATGLFYHAKLSDCGSEVDRVAQAWAGQHALTAGQRVLEQRSATLHFTSPRFPDGTFVIAYTLASDRARARLHVTSKRSLSAQDLEGLGTAALIDNLLTAAKCAAPG